MSIKYGKFEIPDSIALDEETRSTTFAKFVVEPFERGFGHTIGNSMRRVLLSSLEAPAIISIRMEGVPHEFMAVDGIIEDMTNVILNLKGAKLRRLNTGEEIGVRESRILTTSFDVTQELIDSGNGQYVVKLGDIVEQGLYEVVNPELPLFTATKPMKKQFDLRVETGRGYVPSERHEIKDKTVDEILIDAAFSPVTQVSYHVDNTRVGQDTDYDCLIIEVTTDGRVTPEEAISFASQICLKHFDVFSNIKKYAISFEELVEYDEGDEDDIIDKLVLRIDEIELSVRSTNCLSGANIETIAELVSIPERRMLEFRNFGKKSLNEIKAKLTDMSLYLGMDLSRYGITQDNVKDKIRQFQDEKKEKKQKVGEES